MFLENHPNIEIRLYNPFASRDKRGKDFVTDLAKVNRRMHNKSLTADYAATMVGGRNIGNEYFGATSHAEFSDLDVLGIGPIVNDVSVMFDTYWNSESVIPFRAFTEGKEITEEQLTKARADFSKQVEEAKDNPYVAALREPGALVRLQYDNAKFYWGNAELLHDAPTKVTAEQVTAKTHLAPNLSAHISQATDEVIIVSPYFVPGSRMVEFLGKLVDKGVRVRILTNSLAANDVGAVHAGYMRYRVGLLKRGVELYEFKSVMETDQDKQKKKWTGSSKASLHAKTFNIDRRKIFVGSFNLDPRSVALNTEMGVIFENKELAGMMADALAKNLSQKAYRLQLVTTPAAESDSGWEENLLEWITIEDGKEVRYTKEPHTSWWQRFSTGFLSMFVAESYL